MEYYEIKADAENFFVFEYRKVWEAIPHFHGSAELLFVTNDYQEVIIDGKIRKVNVGEGCFADSFTVHAYKENVKSKSYVVIIDRKLFDKIILTFNNKVPPEFFTFSNYELLNNLLKLCNKHYKNNRIRQNILYGAMEILLSEIAENNDFISRNKSKKSLLVKDILLYAENNLTEDLSLSGLSSKFNYSKEHLSRTLNKYLSENWSTYINRLRVERANFLLKNNTNKSVIDIAFSCGFDSIATFYRAYKKEYNINPRQIHNNINN